MTHSKVIDGRHYGTGKRKNAIARVFLSAGTGTVTVNGRTFENYFPREILRIIAMQPFAALGCCESVTCRHCSMRSRLLPWLERCPGTD